jgi:uncharacterized protein
MTRAALASAALVLALGATGAWARDVPVLRARVTDEAGVLGDRRTALEQRLFDYERETGHQIAVLTIRSLQGEVLEPYSMKVAEAWRLGDRRRDDGVLVLVAVDDHAARIEVGYGLEGAIPDVIAGRILREQMIPRFKSGDYPGGIEAGVDALMRAAKGEALGPPPRRGLKDLGGNSRSLLLFALVALSVLLRLPRIVRAPLAAAVGGFIGWSLWSAVPAAVLIALGAGVLALILPTVRGYGGYYGGYRSGGSWGSSSGGGFSGGGGGFGGGGASGRW